MNKLEKFFNTLHSSQSRLLKEYTTKELVSQIKEYIDFTPYICKNIYRMLISQSLDDRKNGAAILKSIMFQFRLKTDFKIEYSRNKDEYFSSTGEEFVVPKDISVKEQTRLVKSMADLEHVDVKIVNEIDFKGDTSIKIKKQKVKDKPIENIMDFFENLTANLLNYEWNKRHGAFLGYTAMFSQAWSGEREIRVDSTLFMKIYEILRNDKFNDFVEDKTTAPVREASAELLACIYPRIPRNTIIEELYKFLLEKDWQTQYSGLIALSRLREYITKKVELCTILEGLLVDADEDVKYLSAELLEYFVEYCDKEGVAKKCWENIRDEEEIAVSKTSIISLLARLRVGVEENIDLLFPCFTSPVVEVRKSVLEMVRNIPNESIRFLIAETILLDENEEVRELAVEVFRKTKGESKNLLNHFMKIIGGSLYEPYSENDFVSYDELYFTKSGVKLIGEDVILRNRILLFECLLDECSSVDDIEICSVTGMTFRELFRKYSKRKEECLCKEESICKMECASKRTKTACASSSILLRDIYTQCSDLQMVPLKELLKKEDSPFTPSLHPMGDPVFRDYSRLKAVVSGDQEDILRLFRVETCEEFLRHISPYLSSFVGKAYETLVEGDDYDSLRILFSVLKPQGDFKSLRFWEKTIEYYGESLNNLRNIFEEAYEKKNIPVLRGFIKDLSYAEDFITRVLKNEDMSLLIPLIPSLDHSFFPLLVKPLLKKMDLKMFSFLVPRLSFSPNPGLSSSFRVLLEKARGELEALVDPKKILEYKSRCPTGITLRNYQVEGVRWISFLSSFNLNGILADDMGLGKTIQVLYFVCSEIYGTDREVLILCPSSLTGHWKGEVERFFPGVSTAIYRKKKMEGVSITIVSYDLFRNDYKAFIGKEWYYTILDEGHVLRNPQTLLYSRITLLKSSHKLILTGTPVHNSTDDLVSLFNIIMPNYLEKMGKVDETEMYSKLEELNKKILPFILRRLKMDVLTDLPPKIIRDITVEMGPIQQDVYSKIKDPEEKDLAYGSDGLKKTRDLLHAASHTSYFLQDCEEVPCKVRALEDIISLCGGEDIRNKILIFFQYKSTIDFVLKHIKGLKYLRLDGTVPSSKRSKIAQDFNDGNIPLLFLTTQIGGLGLNLTGADTVVFYEHDWNPFNDLQAMDRAHRIGQKKTVNVFRLITKNTIEEKVMDLQSFKMFIASSLVSQQNADIETMDTKDLLERFQTD